MFGLVMCELEAEELLTAYNGWLSFPIFLRQAVVGLYMHTYYLEYWMECVASAVIQKVRYDSTTDERVRGKNTQTTEEDPDGVL